jgi:hypothetical protein
MIFFTFPIKNPRGQAALFLVVAVVIGLSAVLSVATRSLLNLRTTSEERESQEAFTAAESGIDDYLKNETELIEKEIGAALVDVEKRDIGGRQVFLNDAKPVIRDDGTDVWLSDFPTFTNPRTLDLTVRWEVKSNCKKNEAALEILYFTGANINNAKANRYLVDPCLSRRTDNNFVQEAGEPQHSVVNGKNQFQFNINSGLLVRITPIYNDAVIEINSSQDLPKQGEIISATGSSGDSSRKIKIYQAYPKIPSELLQYAILVP